MLRDIAQSFQLLSAAQVGQIHDERATDGFAPQTFDQLDPGLAGAAAAATLGELGYKVKVFTYHDSPRRAHSIAAQGGINAAKNYQGDGDSVYRLFYDTVKGGDFRSREANVYRLSQVSRNIIDQATAMGVPFLPTRSMLGTDTMKYSAAKVVEDPFTGKPICLVPALILDVGLPRLDGWQVLDRLRSDPRTRKLKELEEEVNTFIKDKQIIEIKFSEYEFPVDQEENDEEVLFNAYHMTFVILYEEAA